MLARLKIATRVNLIPLLVTFGVVASSAIGLWTLRSQMMEDRRLQLRNVLDLTLSIARADMQAAGGPASDAGRKAFLSALRSARFGNESEANYIFAYDNEGNTVSHIDPRKIGQNRLNTVYANGVNVVQKFIEIARSSSGTGFIEYPMEKGAGGPITPKLTLVQSVPEIGGVVGVGVYIDDIDTIFLHRTPYRGVPADRSAGCHRGLELSHWPLDFPAAFRPCKQDSPAGEGGFGHPFDGNGRSNRTRRHRARGRSLASERD